MSEQKIEAPTKADIDEIARAVIHAKQVVEETLGLTALQRRVP